MIISRRSSAAACLGVSVLLACVSLCRAIPARPVPPSAPNPGPLLMSLYKQREAALRRHDVNAVLSFYTADYHLSTVNGTPSDAARLRKALTGLSAARMKGLTYTTTYTLEGCQARGDAATLRLRIVKRQTVFPTPRHSVYYATELGELRDVWVSRGGRWQQQSCAYLSDRTTYSLKPIAAP